MNTIQNNNQQIVSSTNGNKKRCSKKNATTFVAATSYNESSFEKSRSDFESGTSFERSQKPVQSRKEIAADMFRRLEQLTIPRPISPELVEIEQRAAKVEKEELKRLEEWREMKKNNDYSHLRYTKPCHKVVQLENDPCCGNEVEPTLFGVCNNPNCTYAHSLAEFRIPSCRYNEWCKRKFGAYSFEDGWKKFDQSLKCCFIHPDESEAMYYYRTGLQRPNLPADNSESYKPDYSKVKVEENVGEEKKEKREKKVVISKPIPATPAPWSGFKNKVEVPLKTDEKEVTPVESDPVSDPISVPATEKELEISPPATPLLVRIPKGSDMRDKALELALKMGVSVTIEEY